MLTLMILLSIAGIGLLIAYVALHKFNKGSIDKNQIENTTETTSNETTVITSDAKKFKIRRIIAIFVIIALFIGGWALAIYQKENHSSSDGSSKTTVSEYSLYSEAKDAVSDKLGNPNNLTFCSYSNTTFYELGNNKYKITGYVDWEIIAGGNTRRNFTVTISFTNSKYTVINCSVT